MVSMAETIVLEATRRDVRGKQVKQLRAEGLIPGVVYGPTFDSLPVQMDWIKLRPALREAGGSHLIQLEVDGEEYYNVLVREVQRDPIRGNVLHVDFYRVRMDVLVRTDVPVMLVGSDAAITRNNGMVMHEMTSIRIECLPGNLPSEIRVDLALLKEVGDSILVSDLPPLPGVTYMDDEDDVVVATSLLPRIEEEEEEEEAEPTSAEPELVRRREEEEEEE
jgi:large subunit ribosomal protein L25